VAVEAGMILAALTFIRKVTQTTTVSEVTEEYIREGHAHILQHKDIPSYVTIFRIHGPFLFGASDKLDVVLSRLPDLPPIMADAGTWICTRRDQRRIFFSTALFFGKR